ncbi:TetR/AcrR family transcriptional regulator [Bacillus sp. SM2101]|uniref:TetR/AcrR family transcriptional regulator n=1 Tax=Bacillaceae TaxID=186817 RepID=UPI001BDE4498|nr:TetR/AcrR family transcriptional regulator [Bacillus sp. SM2101]
MDNKTTLQKILDVGQHLIQKNGYNGFSYADIAEQVGIKKASIHYYFPSKKELVQAVLQQYHKDFLNDLFQIDQKFNDPVKKLKAFFQLYRNTLDNNSKICLCTMMAAEISSFPEEIRGNINQFFVDNAKWLENVLAEKKATENPIQAEDLRDQARLFLAVAQGAPLLVRTSGNFAQYDSMVDHLLTNL